MAPAPGAAEPADATAPPVCVLFIHGIGDQDETETLIRFGEPLYDWLRRWLDPAASQRDRCCCLDSVGSYDVGLQAGGVLRRGRKAGSPTFAEISFTPKPAPGGGMPSPALPAWILAETWWAEEFKPASFQEVARMAILVGPWMVIRSIKPKRQRRMRQPTALLAFGLTFVFAALVQAFMLILLVLAIFPPLRPYIGALQSRIASPVGDSLIFATSPVRRQALVAQVQRDVAWLGEPGAGNCSDIAVIAHSQGTVIAHEALKAGAFRHADKVRLFITFGNAFKKLHLLRYALDHPMESMWAAFLVTLASILTVGGLVAVVVTQGAVWAWLLLLGAALSAFLSTRPLRGARSERLGLEEGLLAPDGVSWIDFFAEADPIPEGRLKFATPTARRRSTPISNAQSVLRDHATYWDNTEMFVSDVADILAQHLLRKPLLSPAERTRVDAFRRRRERRVDALAATYFLVLLGLVFIWVSFGWNGLQRVAEPVMAGASSWAVSLGLPGADRFRGLVDNEAAMAAFGPVAAAMMIAIAAALPYYLIVERAWKRWGNVERSLMMDRMLTRPARSRAIAMFMATACLLIVAEVVTALTGPDALISSVSTALSRVGDPAGNSFLTGHFDLMGQISGFLQVIVALILLAWVVPVVCFGCRWFWKEHVGCDKPLPWEPASVTERPSGHRTPTNFRRSP